jgi:hypothetical protein
MRTTRFLALTLALLVSVSCVPAGAAQTPTPETPTVRADFNIRFPRDIALSEVVDGQVASVAPSAFRARVTVLIGGAIGTSDLRPILRLADVRGRSTPAWTPLSVHFTASQVRRIRGIARKQHRRPVLDVQVCGKLAGRSQTSCHARQFVLLPTAAT